MNLNATKCAATAVVVLLAVVGVLFLRERRSAAVLRAENDAIRRQAILATDENNRLLDELKAVTDRAANDQRELLQLRSKAATFANSEKEVATLKTELERIQKSAQGLRETESRDNPFDRHHGPGAGVRVQAAKHLGLALLMHASDHQGQFPGTLQEAFLQLPNEIAKSELENVSQQAAQFELLFHGTRGDLEKLPPESTIIAREKQVWMDKNGRWCRAYTMADGSSTIRSSEQNDFEQWERLRIPAPRQQ